VAARRASGARITTTTTRTRSGSTLRLVGLAAAVYLGVLLLFLVALGSMRGPEAGTPAFGPQVAIVELEGMILDVEDLVADLKRHRENPLVRAVVVRINSPGGVVGPTQEVHQALLRVREAKKPVVASLGAIAASGGYYIAVAADQIYANPGTLTGSIGVIMQMANFGPLLKKVGVDYVVVKAGEFKDVGNLSRPMTPEERRVLQTLLDDVHAQFIQAVADGRKLEVGEVRRFADGRIFSGQQAKDLGMVDTLGSLEDAVNRAAVMAGLPVPPRVIPPRRRISVFDLLRNEVRSWLPAGLTATRLAPALPMFKTPLYLMD
jgi:protease-4